MKLFESYRQTKLIKAKALAKLDQEIENACDDDRVTSAEVVEMMSDRRRIVMNGNEQGISNSDVLKVVANVAIVAVMVGFEMSHIMNQKGSRFIKAL